MNYTQKLKTINTLEELNQLKESFLSDCKIRENKILVTETIKQINSFGGAQNIFESLIIPLMRKENGKKLINKYTSTIKENKSLKTIYTYNEGLKENKTSDSKKTYITEALSLNNNINKKEYLNGVNEIINIIFEACNILGDEYFLNNIKYNDKFDKITESLLYLTTTKKDIKNLNEYMSHIDNVSEIISENIEKDTFNSNSTLEDIVNEMKLKNENVNLNKIFNNDNKEEVFNENKQICLDIISKQKNVSNDSEVINKLNEIENKLSKKNYTFETFTKDILYMTELQEILK